MCYYGEKQTIHFAFILWYYVQDSRETLVTQYELKYL